MDPEILILIDGLDVADLWTVVDKLRAILDRRATAARDDVINWEGMSSLELAGVLAAAKVALARAILRTDAEQAAAILHGAAPLTIQ